MVLEVFSKKPLNKTTDHIATSELIYTEIQLTGFYMIQAFT